MTRITITDAMWRQLSGCTDPVDLCDANGQILGRFLPAAIFSPSLSEDGCPFTDEQLTAMEQVGGGMPLREFWLQMGRKCDTP